MTSIRFKHPEPEQYKTRIWPVFMPFIGCPARCVYCSQERQTGTGAKSLTEIYQAIEYEIPAFFSNGDRSPMELAFFGGTFTALPFDWQIKFMKLAARFKKSGFITRIRFSTRPDCITPEQLGELKEVGLDTVELGIQSFSARTLKRSARNYSPETAMKACRTVKQSDLQLVIQLLPGLPGSSDGDFQQDIGQTIEIAPEAVRIYPCLTVRGTALEKLYIAGRYTPWSLERAEKEIAAALIRLWEARIHVIRIGVAHEEGFEKNIVAGPFHPALGQSARSRALYLFLCSKLEKNGITPRSLSIPSKYSGELWGHKGNLKPHYEKLGISAKNTDFSKSACFELHF